MNRIALVRTHIKAGVLCQHTLRNSQRLVVTQYCSSKAAALHLRELVNQHIASSHNLAFEPEPPAEQKCLAEGAAVSEFGEVQLDAFNPSQVHVARIVRISNFDAFLRLILAFRPINMVASSY